MAGGDQWYLLSFETPKFLGSLHLQSESSIYIAPASLWRVIMIITKSFCQYCWYLRKNFLCSNIYPCVTPCTEVINFQVFHALEYDTDTNNMIIRYKPGCGKAKRGYQERHYYGKYATKNRFYFYTCSIHNRVY